MRTGDRCQVKFPPPESPHGHGAVALFFKLLCAWSPFATNFLRSRRNENVRKSRGLPPPMQSRTEPVSAVSVQCAIRDRRSGVPFTGIAKKPFRGSFPSPLGKWKAWELVFENVCVQGCTKPRG